MSHETSVLEPVEEPGPDRRTLFKAAAAVTVPVAAAGVVAACSSSGGSNSQAAGSSSGGAAGSGGSGSGSGSGKLSVPTSSIPVGGGTVVSGVVVTQPTAGTYKAFSAVCTHAGCLVNKVADGQIVCPCHGSTYSAVDGSVTGGPAPSPLTPLTAKLDGGSVDVTGAAS